jgi:DNA-binding transcriptional regulator YhcF (GntR family)
MDTGASYLDDLDPDDPRTSSQQIASKLRAAILTRKLQPGDKLPSQAELASRYGVARETVKSALRLLDQERLIVSRQGSGAYVRARTERARDMRSHLEAAFERPHVTIDFAGFSGETLSNTLAEVFDRVRAGRLTPQSLRLRLLVADTSAPLVLPVPTSTGIDDPAVRRRSERISRRALGNLVDAVAELTDLGLVKSAEVEVRTHRLGPQLKLYVLNNEEIFFGFYTVSEYSVPVDGEQVAIYDVLGKDSLPFHYSLRDDDAGGAEHVEQARAWFESIWSTIAREYRP